MKQFTMSVLLAAFVVTPLSALARESTSVLFADKEMSSSIYAAEHEGEGKCGKGKCGDDKKEDKKDDSTSSEDKKESEKCGAGKCGSGK